MTEKTVKITAKEYFLKLIWPYWQSAEKGYAWLLLTIALALSALLVYSNIIRNAWFGRFYDAIQTMDQQAFIVESFNFAKIVSCYVCVLVIRIFIQRLLKIRWRLWLTNFYIKPWLSNDRYYHLHMDKSIDNPDQRISYDINVLSTNAVELCVDLLERLMNIISFIGILWVISGVIQIPLPGGSGFKLQGYIVYVVLLYCFIGSFIAIKLGKPIVKLDATQEKFEANFRYDLIRTSEYSEEIALYRGGENEKAHLRDSFAEIVTNFKQLTTKVICLNSWQNIYTNAAVIFPFIIAAPMYFAHTITLGVLMRIRSGFMEINDSLDFIVSKFVDIAALIASAGRLIEFKHRMQELEANIGRIKLAESSKNELVINNLSLQTPAGDQLLHGLNLTIEAGEKLLLVGRSGLGKSTLMRAIAGIWHHGQGSIALPTQQSMMFIPQRSYIPAGTLRDVLIYPSLKFTFTEVFLKKVMVDCGLQGLIGQLDEYHNWPVILSAGEKQRIAFVRTILHQPSWIIMDEPTASLDYITEEKLFTSLTQHLPNASILTISHNTTIKKFHDRVVDLEPNT